MDGKFWYVYMLQSIDPPGVVEGPCCLGTARVSRSNSQTKYFYPDEAFYVDILRMLM